MIPIQIHVDYQFHRQDTLVKYWSLKDRLVIKLSPIYYLMQEWQDMIGSKSVQHNCTYPEIGVWVCPFARLWRRAGPVMTSPQWRDVVGFV
jgi:hypothetical protein